MKDFPQKKLMIHYLLGICTPREVQQMEEWLKENVSHVQLLEEVAKKMEKEAPLSIDDKKEIKKNIFSKIERTIANKDKALPHIGISRHRNYSKSNTDTAFYKAAQFWLKAAAILLVIITAGIAGYYSYDQNPNKTETIWKQRILPYGQTATLRFSDGTMIKLKGGSTLRYPQEFGKKSREVYLKGEAFFSVIKNPSQPFIVHAGHILTRDLGTSFDIKAYDDEKDVRVAVAEGEVAVSKKYTPPKDSAQHKSILLKKNQWVTYHNDSGVLETGEGNIWNMIAWKDQVLVFDNKTFGEVAHMLERWYGVKVIIKDENLKKVLLAGEHEDVSLQKVLDSIQFILGIDYTIQGDVVTIHSAHYKHVSNAQ